MTDDAIQKINTQLESHRRKLENIQNTLQHIAVQDEQIKGIRADIQTLWKKYDLALGPQGVVQTVQHHQASCPRGQIKWFWVAVVPLGFLNLALAAQILIGMGGS